MDVALLPGRAEECRSNAAKYGTRVPCERDARNLHDAVLPGSCGQQRLSMRDRPPWIRSVLLNTQQYVKGIYISIETEAGSLWDAVHSFTVRLEGKTKVKFRLFSTVTCAVRATEEEEGSLEFEFSITKKVLIRPKL